MLRDLLMPSDFLAKIDLKDAYFAVSTKKITKSFFGFFLKIPTTLRTSQHIKRLYRSPKTGSGLVKKTEHSVNYLSIDEIFIKPGVSELVSNRTTVKHKLFRTPGWRFDLKSFLKK